MRKALFFIVALLTAATAWAETQTVSYIDADGIEQTVTATVLTEGGWHETGWYIVSGNIEASSLIFDGIEVDVPTNLILADGATLTLSNGLYALDAFTIYGQRNGTGKFTNIPSQSDTYAIRANGDINIHGGVIEAIGGSVYGVGITTMSFDKEQHITITGGKVTAVGGEHGKGIIANKGNITIIGGQVNTSGDYGLRVENNTDNLYTITLGCTSPSDFIYSSYNRGANVKIVDGQTLVDDDDNEYSGTYIEDESAYDTLFGKTLHLPRTKYDITMPESFEHGMVTCNKQTASEGQTVTLTVMPDNGYELETLTVMNGATAVAVTPSDEEGKYTFVMPAAAVNVNATFTAIDYTITIADGIENGTVVADKHIANIGDIVTLTVTPDNGYELETLTVMNGATAVAVTPSDEESKYTFIMLAAPVNVNATFVGIPISQDGDTYTIHTATGWDLFCDMLEGGESFSGKTVKLGADISVSRMAGKTGSDDSTPFGGTFDGCGHTLTFNYTGSEDFIAPFSWTTWTASPTFRNLTISGTINTTGGYAAGLVGHLYGTVTVEHCTSNVDITAASGGSGFVGLCEHTVNFSDCLSSAVIHSKGGNNSGFVGWSRASGYAINFTGCVFNGKLLQIDGEGGINGGFIGWTGSNKTVTITDCLVNPAALADGETMATGSTATFARGWNATTTATNSYYTAALGAPQCTQARSITAGENVTTLENAGTPSTVYNVSGITAYPTGIKYNDVLYAGDGDNVSLTLGHSDIEHYTFNGYEASAGTLSGNANPYTLTMPDEDVVIGANYVATYVTYLDMDGDEQRCYDFTLLTPKTTLVAGWYVVDGNINFNRRVNVSGDVHIILKDGAVMNVGTEDSSLDGLGIRAAGCSISIYGQSTGENMGQLNVYAESCIDITNGNITICGGKVLAIGHDSNGQGLKTVMGNITITGGEVTATGAYGIRSRGSVTITGGQVTANGAYIYGIFAEYGNVTISGGKVRASGNDNGICCFDGSVTISGGQVTATGYSQGIYASDGGITLGWTNDSDYIYANSYYNNYENITIADGKAFIDEDNNIYSGSVPTVEYYGYPIDDKTLRPYSPIQRGDVNGDGNISIADVTMLIGMVLRGDTTATDCPAGDVNSDGSLSIADVTMLIGRVLRGSW